MNGTKLIVPVRDGVWTLGSEVEGWPEPTLLVNGQPTPAYWDRPDVAAYGDWLANDTVCYCRRCYLHDDPAGCVA